MKFSEMNRHQKAAYLQVIAATNWVIGGYENSVADGDMDDLPSEGALVSEIYDTVLNCTTGEGFQSSRPIKEIRFCTREWIMERVERRVRRELKGMMTE
jgi:hypothetical protein